MRHNDQYLDLAATLSKEILKLLRMPERLSYDEEAALSIAGGRISDALQIIQDVKSGGMAKREPMTEMGKMRAMPRS